MRDDAFITAWIRLAFTPKVGPKTFEKLLRKFGTPATVLANAIEVKRRYKLELEPPSVTEAEDSIAKCYNFGGNIILSCDELYPELLKETEGHPVVLFTKGKLELLKKTKISIVGTRNSSINGEKITRKLASDLGQRGIVVVSGLARGIDSAAHQGSLETGTIGVVANGIDCFYPKENEQLQRALYEKGLVMSENPINSLPISQNFPRRNRIISGISIGVLVTEAKQNSGTMITANYALEQGREVFAVPGSPTDPRAYGTNFLIKNGAVLVRDVDDILCEIAIAITTSSGMQPQVKTEDLYLEETDDITKKLLNKLNNLPTDLEGLFSSLEISVQEFNKIIVELELSGKVVRQGNKLSTV